MRGKKELGVTGKVVVDFVGFAAGKAVKVCTGSEAAEALAASVIRIASEKLLTVLQDVDPSIVIGVTVLGTAAVIYAPAVVIASLLGDETPRSDDEERHPLSYDPIAHPWDTPGMP